jgi:hypothetical protein
MYRKSRTFCWRLTCNTGEKLVADSFDLIIGKRLEFIVTEEFMQALGEVVQDDEVVASILEIVSLTDAVMPLPLVTVVDYIKDSELVFGRVTVLSLRAGNLDGNSLATNAIVCLNYLPEGALANLPPDKVLYY